MRRIVAAWILAACSSDALPAPADAAVADLSSPSDLCAGSPSDPERCGACGRKCCPGNTCSAGSCAPGCASGLTACANAAGACDGSVACGGCVGGTCTNLAADNQHCGSCTTACAAGQTCVAGTCQ